jgi:RNase H-fold protein (predicted Holliday junction resolvase)
MGVCFGVILGIDPGREKTGWALVAFDGELIRSGIFLTRDVEAFLRTLERPVDQWEKELEKWTCERRFPVRGGLEYVALGDGTGSREIASRLRQFKWKIILVNEKGTTLAARELYWRLHDFVLWQRWLPRSLRVPSRNVDDLAAWSIVLHSLAMSCETQRKISTA